MSLERAAVAAAYQQRWDEAFELLQRACEAGEPLALAQMRALAGRHPRDLLDPPVPERITERAALFACKGYAPEGFAPWLIERAGPRLAPSLVEDPNVPGGRHDPKRTATTCVFGEDYRDIIVAIMQERAARLARVPLAGHEAPSVIRYEAGQGYDYHFDFIHADAVEFLDKFGQRVVTIVTYLNEDFVGAQTDFPRLDIAFRGAIGDAVAFSNVLADGSPDHNTLHAGLPPVSGTKWVLSQWLRNKPQTRS